MNRRSLIAASSLSLLAQGTPADTTLESLEMDGLSLTTDWDKTFPKSPKVSHRKVVFHNRFGIAMAADLYRPKDQAGKLPAIAVSGPFGAVKEQSSGLYAQRLAEAGFLTLAFDPSFTGESGGMPRHLAGPDLCTEDFSAAVDYLATCEEVEANRIGILGICGWGGFALNAAAIDTRIRATVASTMYDMCRVTANGYDDKGNDAETRHALRQALNAQRTEDFKVGNYARTIMNPEPAADAPQFMKDYFDYYKKPRGYHPRSINSGLGWNVTMSLSFLNSKLLAYAHEIDTPVLIVPNANHTDLYDSDKIPFEQIIAFYRDALA